MKGDFFFARLSSAALFSFYVEVNILSREQLASSGESVFRVNECFLDAYIFSCGIVMFG